MSLIRISCFVNAPCQRWSSLNVARPGAAADSYSKESVGSFTQPFLRIPKNEVEVLGTTAEEDVVPHSMVLFNESFAATNEREGSEIAFQVVSALREKCVKVVFVTHLYDFAERLLREDDATVLFLRAERLADGTRRFRIVPGTPLQTSFGEDVYRKIFAVPEKLA